MNLEEATLNALREDNNEYEEYIAQQKALADDYCQRVTDKVTPDVIRNFGKLKEILEDGSDITEQEGYYFPEEAINILKNTDRRHNLNGFMDLTIADILNMVSNFDTPEEAIEDMFNEYKPDSALAWGDNFVTVLSQLVFNMPEDTDYEYFEESKDLPTIKMKPRTDGGANYKKIDIYVDGKYWCSTNAYKTIKSAIENISKEYPELEGKKLKGYFAESKKVESIDDEPMSIEEWKNSKLYIDTLCDYFGVSNEDELNELQDYQEMDENIITDLYNSYLDNCNKEESKEIKTESTTPKTLYDALEQIKFEDIDIADDENGDLLVAFCLDPEDGDSDSYSRVLTKIAKGLEVYEVQEDVIICKVTDWVTKHKEVLSDLFETDDIDELVGTDFPGIISGYITDDAYSELDSKLNESKEVKTEDIEEHNLSKDLFGAEAERRLSQEQKDLQKDLQYVRDIMAGKEVIDDKYHEKLSLDTAKKWLRKDFVNVNCLASADPDDIDKKLAKEYPDIFGKEIKTEVSKNIRTEIIKLPNDAEAEIEYEIDGNYINRIWYTDYDGSCQFSYDSEEDQFCLFPNENFLTDEEEKLIKEKIHQLIDKKEECNKIITESEEDKPLEGKDVFYVFEDFDTGVDKNQENLIKYVNEQLKLGLDPIKDDLKIALEIQKMTGKQVVELVHQCYGNEIGDKFETYLDERIESGLNTNKIKYIKISESIEYMSKEEFDKLPKDYKSTVGETIKTAAIRGEDPEALKAKYKEMGYEESDPMVLANENGGTVLKPVKITESYEANKEYEVKYITQEGKEECLHITPESDMTTPQMITKLKEENKDFFKLLECKETKKICKNGFRALLNK